MQILFKTLLILCVCILGFNTYPGTIDPNTNDQKYIDYGAKFEFIVKITGKYRDNKSFAASAVIIDSHHIITAAHVVEDVKFADINLKKVDYRISKITTHKNFNMQNYGVADIAIGYSKNPFNLDFYPALYVQNNEKKQLCSIVGYGFTGTFITGAKKYDNKKRGGSNFIDYIDKDLLICSPSKKNDDDFTSLEFLIASGDSGGGLFIDGKLAGINSCVIAVGKSPKSVYGDQSGHTRISKYMEWIDSIRQENLLDSTKK
jgi:secreted trypsin-like serine protease